MGKTRWVVTKDNVRNEDRYKKKETSRKFHSIEPTPSRIPVSNQKRGSSDFTRIFQFVKLSRTQDTCDGEKTEEQRVLRRATVNVLGGRICGLLARGGHAWWFQL